MTYKKGIILVLLVAFNLRLGISSVPPILGIIKESLGLSNFQASLMTGIPILCMGFFAFFVANVQQKFGRKQGIFILLVILGVSMLSRAIITGYVSLLVTTLLIGASIAIIGPLLSGFIKEQFNQHAGLMIGTYSFGMGLGSVIVSNKMLFFYNLFNNNWQMSLAIWGVITIVAALAWQIFTPSKSKIYSNNNSKNRFKIRTLLKKGYVWKMILFFGLQSGIFYGFSTWISQFLIDKGVSLEKSVVLLTLFTGIQMTGSFLIPALMDRFGTIKKWILFCTFSMISSTVMFLFFSNETIFIGAIVLMAIGSSGLFPIAMLLPLRVSHDAKEASVITSLVQAYGYLIGGTIPIFIGILIDFLDNYNALLWQMIIGLVILFIIGQSNIIGEEKDDVN